VSDQPMRFRPLLEGCDLLVTHGGNVAPGALMAGVPQLIFPRQYEQYLTALRMEQVGCGLWLQEAAASHEVLPALKRVLGEPRFAAAARAFAARYAAFSPSEQQRRMVLRIEQILAKPPILSPSSTPKEQ
jgi:UDP:flavonoid glycosyltransferase YjiC (YdhE family)